MKIIKRIFLIILVLTTVGLLFRGYIYRNLVAYKSVGLRNNYLATDHRLTEYIDSSINKQADPDIEKIIKLGLSMTSKRLNFTVSKNEVDPNRLINSKTAHCVGYASFFATTCNYLFKRYNMSGSWTAKPQIGQLYFLGTNIHKYFESPFFKDHDFVIIENKKTGEIYAIDPTINDYLFIESVAYIK